MCIGFKDQSGSKLAYENDSPCERLAALVALLPLPQLTGAGQAVVDEEEVGGGIQSHLDVEDYQISCQLSRF